MKYLDEYEDEIRKDIATKKKKIIKKIKKTDWHILSLVDLEIIFEKIEDRQIEKEIEDMYANK